MVRKYITKKQIKPNFKKSRKLIKKGGVGTAERLAATNKQKASGILSKLDSLIDINRDTTENIYSKIQELKTLYGIGIQAEPAYDIGAAEHVSPSYDIGAAEHVSPSYDIAQAHHESPSYDIAEAHHESPSYDIAEAHHESPSYDIAAAAKEPEYAFLEPLVKVKVNKKKNTVPFTIRSGTWDFYILKILDNDPKSENEISALMKEKFPTRMSGKTPDNTLNTRLQILVKEGYANRMEYKKRSRKIYKYFLPSDV